MNNLFLQGRHQGLVFFLMVIGFCGIAVYVGIQQLGGVRLVDIDLSTPRSASYQVDLNSADWPELAMLPGIGEKLAQSIVEHRQQKGRFRRHEELLDIHGIGESKYAALKPHLLPITNSD